MKALCFVLVLVLATGGEASSPLWSRRGVLEGDIPQGKKIEGDPTVLIADPVVPRPDAESCNIPLFDYQFYDYQPNPFNFSIPSNCMGEWSKVVLNIEIACSAGRQFDRTMTIYLNEPKDKNQVHIFTGTTPEPRANLAPSVSVELDITQYSSLLKEIGANGSGIVDLFTVVNDKYNGVPQATASIDVYLTQTSPPGYLAPSKVLALGDKSLNNGTDSIFATVVIPEETNGVWLEVTTQGQGGDEFWWSCNPSGSMGECANSAFRILVIHVNQKIAYLSPVYPYLFTGGVNPSLWQPTPGVQTLNLQPMRIDLTGIVGTGINEIKISIGGMDSPSQINSHWYVAANLLYNVGNGGIPRDSVVEGTEFQTLVGNGLFPIVTESFGSGSYFTSVVYEASWSHEISWKVNGSKLADHSEITHSYLKFSNTQSYQNDGSVLDGEGFTYSTISQECHLYVNSSGGFPWSNSFSLSQTLSTTTNLTGSKDGSAIKVENDVDFQLGWYYESIAPSSYTATVKNTVNSHVNSVVTNITSSNSADSSQAYFFLDSRGNTYSRTVASDNNLPISNVTQASSMEGWSDPYWGRK